jgi:hypothetical protein
MGNFKKFTKRTKAFKFYVAFALQDFKSCENSPEVINKTVEVSWSIP